MSWHLLKGVSEGAKHRIRRPNPPSIVCLLGLTSVYSGIGNCCVVPAFGEAHQWAQAHFLVWGYADVVEMLVTH
jgi:hypothetical protein